MVINSYKCFHALIPQQKYFIFYGPVLSPPSRRTFSSVRQNSTFPSFTSIVTPLSVLSDGYGETSSSKPVCSTDRSVDQFISNRCFASAKMAGSVMPITISSASVMQHKQLLSRHRFLSADVLTGNPTYRLTAALRKRRLLHGLLVRLYRLIRHFGINGVLFKNPSPFSSFRFANHWSHFHHH